MEIDDITGIIIDKSMQLHKNLGPGLLESVYEAVLSSASPRESKGEVK